MLNLPVPADGVKAFDLSPLTFLEIATWTKSHGARVVSRRVFLKAPHPVVLVAYVIPGSSDDPQGTIPDVAPSA
jgi:hypothetical protein